mgnify:CR=1 FL=1
MSKNCTNAKEFEAIADELLARAKAAAAVAEDLNQEQVDRIVRNIGKAVYDRAEELAIDAVEETRMGFLETKIRLNEITPLFIWDYMKDKKSVGILEDDKLNHVVTLAKPMGIIACLTPSTNTATPVHNAMIAIKGRNVVIICPHPRAAGNAVKMVDVMRKEIAKLGYPADMIQVAVPTSLELTNAIMQRSHAILATGGEGMVKAAYSSGKPSFGVGQGNAQCILHTSYTDYEAVVKNIMFNRTQDNGVPCVGEQTLIMPRDKFNTIVEIFKSKGAYLVEDPAQIDMIRKNYFVDGIANRDIVGQLPYDVARLCGFEIPKDTKLMLVRMTEKYGREEPLCREIMCPMTRLYVYDDFEDGVEIARANLLVEGAGHSSVIYANDEKIVEYVADRLPVGRVLVNMGNNAASGMGYGNGLAPTNSVGCGTWGGNSVSENITHKHLMNMTKVAYPIPNPATVNPVEIWGD